MITGERMAAVDENAEALGVPRKQLMESSGHAVARTVRKHAEPGSRVVVVAGRGNNGGDALVAVRFLDDHAFDLDVITLLLGRAETITTDIARENWDALEACEYDVREVTDSNRFTLPQADVVVDAMLGTGISGDLREPVRTAARAINEADATVISVDVPSGFDADSGNHAEHAVDADHVVTFHDTKPGLEAAGYEIVPAASTADTANPQQSDQKQPNRNHQPEEDQPKSTVTVADIGIPSAAERFVGPGDVKHVRPNARTGRAFVIGGGPYTGAPALAAQAALRTGAELSFVAVPDTIARDVQSYAEDLIVQPYEDERLAPEHVPDLVETAETYDDVVILGPGLGTAPETLDATRAFLESYTGPVVVDADALSVVPEVKTEATLVCTPNRRELAAMGGPELDDLRAGADGIEALASDLGHVILAKGVEDVISDGERTRVVRVGTPGMAVGGTGDVLAGIVSGLLEHAPPFEAACAGAYVNGIAGERLAESDAGGFLASDLLSELPAALWGDDRD